jgi:exopolyphosphatase/pppGpp-phosphohydrolase
MRLALVPVLALLSWPALAGAEDGRICALDMGSNTFKFAIGAMKDGQYVESLDVRDTLGVGDDLSASRKETGHPRISDGKLAEIGRAVGRYRALCEKHTGKSVIYAVATAAFRQAENRSDYEALMKKLGVRAEIATGERESSLAYEASVLGKAGYAVVDLGSRSTEFVSRPAPKALAWKELDTGYKTAFDAQFKNAPTFARAMDDYLAKLIPAIDAGSWSILQGRRELVLIEAGELASDLLGIPQEKIEGTRLTRERIARRIAELRALDESGYSRLKRDFALADKVLPRLVFVSLILERSGYPQATVTNRELNAGLIAEHSAR